jgi:hypothetical protein
MTARIKRVMSLEPLGSTGSPCGLIEFQSLLH